MISTLYRVEDGAAHDEDGAGGVTTPRRGRGGDITDLALDAPGVEPDAVLPWPLLFRERIRTRATSSDRYRWIVLATALFGLFTVGFTITILAVSVKTMAEDFGSTPATLAWVVTGPMLAFAVIGPAAGKLADIYGHRRFFLWGLTGAGIFALLTALSWSAASVIGFRVVGATLGAACGPSSMALINRLFPRESRAKAMGYWSLVGAGGPVLGVVAGGPIVEAFGWRWIFVGQAPIIMVAVLVAAAVLPETERSEKVPFDFLGSVLLGGSSAFALLALNRGPEIGWTHPLVLSGFLFLPVGLALFVHRQRTFAHPLIPLEYFGRRNFTFPIATQMLGNFAYMGGFILTPLVLQDVLGYGESKTGLVSIARPLLFAIAGPIAGAIAVRAGERNSAVFGISCIVASMVGLSMIDVGTGALFVAVALGLSGIGMGATSPAMAASLANAVDERDLGIAGAAQQMMTQVAAVLGIQILQTVQAAQVDSAGLAGSYSHAYLVGGGVAALAIVTAFMVRSTKDEVVEERSVVDAPQAAIAAGK